MLWARSCALNTGNYEISELLKLIADPSHAFYKTIPELDTANVSLDDDWRSHIKIGDMVDCIKEEDGLVGWSHARVVNINENKLSVQFIGDCENIRKYLYHLEK